jgi:hypothetical protein
MDDNTTLVIIVALVLAYWAVGRWLDTRGGGR